MQNPSPAAHPLDPLSADEIRAVTALLAREHGVNADWRYASIEMFEPSKAEITAFDTDGTPAERVAVAVLFDRTANRTYKARVSLTADAVNAFDHIPDVQANVTVDEWDEADQALRAHPDVIAALAARGITDMSLVFMDTWTYGAVLIPEEFAGRRIGWSDTWVRGSDGANPYAGPVNGFHCVIDLNTMELLRIEDTFRVDRPQIMGEYVPRMLPKEIREASTRPERKPLEITQPEGPGFTLEGNKLTWQNWSLRVGFNYREGMTLHAVTYNDNGNVRKIAHRLSFAEMMVPYRDHCEDHYRRTAFDIGEWGLGFMTTSLALGCDCLGEIRYLDATLHDSKGEPYDIANAICIHEEDNAVLWKHVDHHAGAEVRRMRRLTVSFHVTVANYEYLTYWRFYEDGNIECEVRATGIMVVSHFPEGGSHPHGTLVDQRTYAPFHQHFIVARMDLDVDGENNTVYRSETQMVPTGPDNPYGLSLRQVNTPLRTESEGKQDPHYPTQRSWKVVNDNVTTGLGTSPSYKLVASANVPAMFDPASPILDRCRAIEHTLWVTPNDREERWPAGEFVNQGGGGMGLPAWTAANRSIENTDVVLWYTFGIHHITRPEDWPIMPADTVSFWLKPFGFFDRNPSIDVAPTPAKSASCCSTETDGAAAGSGCCQEEK
ncbi:primary-amine oxidase [Tsukamurella tyrosinosolvens]|uniref:primary-amine oxidase n=1 Tax=Tsukamurella tyrosinosolvens TaxID=57704 RepID=UPI000791A544|nr:primary-amine oxidase [Tsukamurella tyrosinosolvens]KXP01197.1 tyramine oxidase [Tsukamurella tyrosinosolvens]KZL94580.1 tyramine oxidase [Tsukamurella tyrosinosolvens]MCA4997377.1 primary-amine oxidase [Tsukamurella tyrosinosolvens]WEL93404.1 primary-amine oxidase [Tsukamurella tyrosinosolvens]